MNRIKKKLLLSLTAVARHRTPAAFFSSSSPLRCLSTTSNSSNPKVPPDSKFDRDSLILQQFRRRQQQGSAKSKLSHTKPSKATAGSIGVQENEVCGYEGLGLRKELLEAVEEMGVGGAPAEIQCVGIPAVLDGKSVVLSSEAGYPRTLSYLLPLVQLLRCNEASAGMKPKHPRAIVLCSTVEMCDECFQMGTFISNHTRSKSSTNDYHSEPKGPTNLTSPPIGMLVGTPREVLEQIEEGYVFCDDVEYLVLDEADDMLRQSFGPMIQKILSQLCDHVGIQTIIVTSPASEMLGKQAHPVIERLGKNHAGEVAAILLEIDKTEVVNLLASVDALKSKMAEAMGSLCSDGQESEPCKSRC